MARKERGIVVENVLESGGATAALYLETASTVYSRAFKTNDVIDMGVSYLMTTPLKQKVHQTLHIVLR